MRLFGEVILVMVLTFIIARLVGAAPEKSCYVALVVGGIDFVCSIIFSLIISYREYRQTQKYLKKFIDEV